MSLCARPWLPDVCRGHGFCVLRGWGEDGAFVRVGACRWGEVSSALRADQVLSPRGKVPKGRRGRPKGACLMAAPGPPVAKQQCTASLAGARPARFTSVPGRATVAFGAADPSPAPRRRSILGVMARYRYGRNTLWQYVLRPRCAGQSACPPWHPIGCWPQAKPNGVPVTDPVGRDTRGRARGRTRGVRGYPSAV